MNNQGRGTVADWGSDNEAVADVVGDDIADPME